QLAVYADVLLQPLVLDFEEEIAFTKNVAKAIRARLGLFVFIRQQGVSHFAAEARGKRDETLAVLRKEFVLDARLVIKPIQIAGRNQLHQISIAFIIFAKQNEMVRALRFRAAVFVIIRCYIHLAAD